MTPLFLHHDGALGDVLLSLPCIVHLRDAFGLVHLAARQEVAELLKEAGYVSACTSSGSMRYLSLFAGEADREMRRFLSGFGRAVVFSACEDPDVFSAVMCCVPNAQLVMTIPPAGNRTHASDFRLRQLGLRGSADEDLLRVTPVMQREAEILLDPDGTGDGQPLILVHPGSGGSAKRWPVERYQALADHFVSGHGARVVMLTGPAEEGDLEARIRSFSRSRRGVVHVASADLRAVAALLSRAELYIGNDSGISHLAARAGCPSIVLFGATDPAIWMPRGRSVRVLAARSMSALQVSEVAAAAAEVLRARPGQQAWRRTMLPAGEVWEP